MKRRRELARSGPIARTTRIRPRKRTPSDFARVYGSRARVAWVKALPCVVPFCGAHPCENHHVISGGTGRKADACWIIPLCLSHHREYHGSGGPSFSAKYGVHLQAAAARIAAEWERFT